MSEFVLENENNSEAENGLSPTQYSALVALLSARTVEDAAERVGVKSRTLRRWLLDENFKKALAAAESELLSHATRRLADGLTGATDTLLTLAARAKSEVVRLRAAQSIIDCYTAMDKAVELENRVRELEGILNEMAISEAIRIHSGSLQT